VRRPGKPTRMSAQDFISYYNFRFGGLRDMILKKLPAVSINKAGSGFSEVSVIGMVREKRNTGFVLEDATGEIEVVGAAEVEPDDVVGITGHIKEGRMFPKEIVWPDVPLDNKPGNIPGLNILLSGGIDDGMKGALDDFGVVFLNGEPPSDLGEETSRKIIHGFPDPCHATIKKDASEFRVLIHSPRLPVAPERCREMLRKRHLFPDRKDISTKEDPFIVDPIPDLFWVISGSQHVERYKGVTIIMSRKHDSVKFDVGTGRVFFSQDDGT
jgi:hypothetical protein